MAKTWKEILSDKANFADDVQVTINGEAVTIGQLRAHDAAHGGETATLLQARETEIASREARTAAAQQKLADIMEAVAKSTGMTFDQIVSGDTAAAQAAAAKFRAAAGAAGITATPSGEIDWATDPIYKPINDRYAPLVQAADGLQKAMRAGATVMQNDRARMAWLEFKLDNPEAAKKLKYDDAVKLAVDKGYLDEVGFPNVRKALEDLAAPGMSAARDEENKKKWTEEGAAAERARMFGAASKPGGMGTAGVEFEPTPANGKVPTIAEALNKAMTDPAVMGMVN